MFQARFSLQGPLWSGSSRRAQGEFDTPILEVILAYQLSWSLLPNIFAMGEKLLWKLWKRWLIQLHPNPEHPVLFRGHHREHV